MSILTAIPMPTLIAWLLIGYIYFVGLFLGFDVLVFEGKLTRKVLCRFGKCLRCLPNHSDLEVWGECVDCGRRYGVATRVALRAFMEREERYRGIH